MEKKSNGDRISGLNFFSYKAHIPLFSFDVPPCALHFRKGYLDLTRALEALVGNKKINLPLLLSHLSMPSGVYELGKTIGEDIDAGIPSEGRTFVAPSFPSNRRAESWELSNDVVDVISGSAGLGNKLNWPDDSVCAARARGGGR